jgi:peptidyl-prolyl cis-trans isomerase B (cyclophilin B)
MLQRVSLALVALACGVLLAACGGGSPTATDGASGAPAPVTHTPYPVNPSKTSCSYPSTSGEPVARTVQKPNPIAQYQGNIPATINSTIGTLHLTLTATATPCTVNSFISLVEQGYYDNTSCHREGNSPGFQFLQCGDPYFDPNQKTPNGYTGEGGPGYTIPDELTGHETYGAGTIAMANTGAKNSGGGQFFICFGKSTFPPQYTVFAHMDAESVALVVKAAKSGNDGYWGGGSGRPNTHVTFTSVTVG